MSVVKMFFFGPGQVFLAPDVEAKIQSRKEFALLAYLAVEADRPHSRENIIGLFWPELAQSQARNNLRVSLARLRKSINHATTPLIHSDRHTISFDGEQFGYDGNAWLDAGKLERLLATVDSHQHDDPTQCPTCLADMLNAAALYQGEFLHGFHLDECEAFEHWLLVQRERYHMQIMELLPRIENVHIANDDWKSAEQVVRQRLSLDPLNESAHRTLMQVLALAGLRNAALSHYEICRKTLGEELGVEPDAETVAVMEQIRAGNYQFLIDDYRNEQVDDAAASDTPAISNRQSKIKNLDPYAVLNRLDPLPDQTLFGVDKVLETVGGAIDAVGRSWLISVEGIGGLGKTTVANALVKQLLERENLAESFQDIGWVSAKQEEYLPAQGVQATGKPALDQESLMDQLLAQLSDGPYPTGSSQEKWLALTKILKEKVCLVVVDNLETAIDYEALLPLLRHLANPSKFLITSRMSLAGQGDVFCYSLSELSQDDALTFLRHEAASRGMAGLASAGDEPLHAIYQAVGGNPLALKLVLGQLQFLPLEQVLESLRQANAERADQLYNYIYRQAWQMLDATSRHLLLCLPVVPNATFDQLRNASALETHAIQSALMNLRSFSLVEMGGDLSEPRYRLHRLTETFLMHEVVKWQEPDLQEDSAEAQYFVQRVLHMVEQWKETEAVHEVDVTILDHEYESVVKAISLGLELGQGWATIKPLIIAFTPFMERRGHWHTWHSILERSIDAARRADDLDGEITLTSLLARLCQRESRPKDVIYYYRRVIRLARCSGDRFEEARAYSNLGYAYIDGDRWWRSEVLSCHALKVFEELGSEHGRAHTHNHLGLMYTRQSRWELAEQSLLEACKIWKATGDSHSLISGFTNLGVLYNAVEKPESALEQFMNALNITETTGETSMVARIYNNLAIAHRLKSDWDTAGKFARKSESLFKVYSDFSGLANVWHNLGLIEYGAGKQRAALSYLEESFNIYQDLNNPRGMHEVQPDIEKVAASA